MFAPKVHLDSGLYERAQKRAKELGYASLQEYVQHLIERDLENLTEEEQAALDERLKGLGYL